MKKLKELLKNNEQVWFQIEDNRREKVAFLNWAKQNNCKWRDKAIEPEFDDCGIFMGIDSDLILGYVGGHCWFEAKNAPKKFNFKDIIDQNWKNVTQEVPKSNNFEGIHKGFSTITSESVNIGHPDKTCDVIADAFLDEALSQDPNAQMAVECAIKNDKLFIYGEATTKAKIDYDSIAKKILKDIGYKNKFKIIKEISKQSPDINHAVVKDNIGANDQGMVYGYATNETKEFMPLPVLIAHKIMQQYECFRRTRTDFFADAKSQVTLEYNNEKPSKISTVLISVSHDKRLQLEEIQSIIKENVLDKVLKDYRKYTKDVRYIINPSGKFTIWGSFGDSGCVGRKIVVDTYGGVAKVGGGCFSSKNATKVDRSGAYYARFVAKNIVAHNLADKCEIQVAYGIGLSKPIAINIDAFNTEKKPLKDIYKYVADNFDFSPANIIKELDLLKPIYKQTACYGHFGRDEFSWEKIKP